MRRKYSRLSRTEEKKNIRRALLFSFLTIASLILVIFLGLPALVKFSAFLTDLRKSSTPIDISDTTPPVLPRLEPLPETINEFNVEIKGSTEPAATVILFLNNKEEEILANKDGEFVYTFALLDGDNKIAAQAKDSSGNESQKTEVYNVTYDNQPPELEITGPEDGNEYYGSKQRQVVIEGKTEDEAQVNINDRLVVVDQDGTFTFTSTLSEGENQFSVKSVDQAGNSTEKSLTLHFSP